MSLVTRATDASIDATTAMYAPQVTGLIAGEDLLMGASCYQKSSDGKAYQSIADADAEAAEFIGVTPRAVKSGEPVTLFGYGTRMRYAASGLTPGNILYIGETAGRYDTAPTTADKVGTLECVSATDVRVIRTSLKGVNQAALGGSVGYFKSTEQTGTGSAQNVAHGLGAIPSLVMIYPSDTAPSTTGAYTMTEGTHTSTNVVTTVTSGKKFFVVAFR